MNYSVLLVLWQASDWRPQWQYSWRHFRQLFQFGVYILGLNFLNFFNTRINDFLIGYFLGSAALGYYAVAYRILRTLIKLLVRTSSEVALPTFSRLQEDLPRFRKTFYSATQLSSLVAFPVFFGVVATAPELIILLFGPQWEASIPLMQVLAFVGMIRSISFFKGSVFMALGKPQWRLWLGFLTVGLNLLGFAIALPWGIVAVTVAYAVRGLLVFPVGQWAISRLIDIPLLTYLQQFIVPLLGSVIMAAGILLMKAPVSTVIESKIAALIVYTLLGALLYGAIIRLAAPQLFKHLLEVARLASSKSKAEIS